MEPSTIDILERLVDITRGQLVGFDSTSDSLDKLDGLVDAVAHWTSADAVELLRCPHDGQLVAEVTQGHIGPTRLDFDCGHSADAPNWYVELLELEAELGD